MKTTLISNVNITNLKLPTNLVRLKEEKKRKYIQEDSNERIWMKKKGR